MAESPIAPPKQGFAARRAVVEYDTDSELRDTEHVPLLEPRGMEAFYQREVLLHIRDTWINADGTRIGYGISFTRHFNQPKPLHTLGEIRADVFAVRKEAEGLLDERVQGVAT